MYKLVSVQFDNSYMTYDYLCDLEDVNIGDYVRIQTKRGIEAVEVTNVYEAEDYELKLPISRYKKVLSKVDPLDVPSGEKRFVDVIFDTTSKAYSYRCEDENINEGDFVWVIALGKKKIAKVVDTYTSFIDDYRPVIGKATEQEIKANIFEFMGDDEYRDESAYDRYNKPQGYHDYDLDEDDYALLTYVEVYLPEYKHTDKYRYEGMELVKGDVVIIDTMVGTAEGIVKKVFFELQKDSDEDLCMMREVLYKLQENPDIAQRNAALAKQNDRKWKLEEKADRGLNDSWKRVERHQQELADSFNPIKFAEAAIASGAAYTVATSQENAAQQNSPTQQELLTSPEYWWHPMNLYYDEDKAQTIDHNQMVDDRGFMVNGKWLAEHERNMSNPGSPFDSRGYAKNPYLEQALQDNFYLEEEQGIHDFDDPSDYDDNSSNDDDE